MIERCVEKIHYHLKSNKKKCMEKMNGIFILVSDVMLSFPIS